MKRRRGLFTSETLRYSIEEKQKPNKRKLKYTNYLNSCTVSYSGRQNVRLSMENVGNM